MQRSLGAKSDFEAKAAYIWGAVLKNIIPVIIAVPGVAAFALYPQLKSGDDAFPKLVAVLLPVGLQGLFLYFSVWAFLIALVIHIIVSYCTKPEPEEKLAGLIYGSNKPSPSLEAA